MKALCVSIGSEGIHGWRRAEFERYLSIPDDRPERSRALEKKRESKNITTQIK